MLPHRPFAVLTLAVLASVAEARVPQRIVGGSEASPSEFPYQVALKRNGVYHCGGAILGERHVLTAAHCVVGIFEPPYTNLTVATGSIFSSEGQSHVVKSVLSHPDYNSMADNDIAIVELADDIKFDEHQNKIGLPSAPVESGKTAIATGWGFLSHRHNEVAEKLMKVTLSTLEHDTCQLFATAFTLNPFQICTYHAPGLGVCLGDSGGPLAVHDELIGIVSYGNPCALGTPDVFTNVYYYLDWIKNHVTKS